MNLHFNGQVEELELLNDLTQVGLRFVPVYEENQKVMKSVKGTTGKSFFTKYTESVIEQ